MRFVSLSGKRKVGNITKYYIDWDGGCRGKSKWGKFQYDVKQFLRRYWENHIVCEEFPCFGTAGGGSKTLKIDIINFTRRVAVEVNGDQHREFNEFFHGDRHGFLNQIERDSRKYEWCQLNEIELVDIYKEDELSENFFKEKYNIVL